MQVLAFGDDNRPYHKFAEYAPRLRSLLEAAGIDVDLTRDPAVFEDDLSNYDTLVSVHPSPSTSEWDFTTAQLDALETFVRDGNGYVPVHSAAAFDTTDPLPPSQRRQARLLGGRMTDHPAVQDVDFHVDRPEHPVMRGVKGFTISDEPYEVTVADDATVLATLSWDGSEDMPACWVREESRGRVCYLSLGHPPATWDHPAFQRVVTNAVEWTGG